MRWRVGLVAALLLGGCADEPYDLVILNGTIVDGSGGAPFQADVGIRGEQIATIGSLANATATVVLDATGLHVAPGFIDVHSHAGGGLATEELSTAHALLAQGITTVVINPDGGGSIDQAAQRGRLLEHGLGVNVAQLVPHGSIRSEVLGQSDREPTAEELDRMKEMVRAGMEEGAFGLSSGLFYTPGIWSTTKEVIEMAKVAAPYGGVYSSHIRDEADYGIGVVAAVDEVIRIAREAGLPGIVGHIKALGPNVWGASVEMIANIEAARAEGVQVWADQYPYDASSTGFVAALVPDWAREGGSLLERMADPPTAARIREGVAENLARRGGGDRIMFRGTGPLAGRTLADVAAERGLNDLDGAIALIQEGASPGIISFNMQEEDIVRFMGQPWTMTSTDGDLTAFGEGVPHPRNYGTFARKIRLYVREAGVIDLQTAIRSMSGLAAEVFGMEHRGAVREGAIADLLVFDLDRVNDPATFDDPHRYSEGMVHVLVNGALAIDGGQFTDALAGQVLHRGGAALSYPRTE
ncbi:MAG: D-aminoacylase [Gemmatimonadota bacterium]